MGGQLLPQSLLFAKGCYYAEIFETDGRANSTRWPRSRPSRWLRNRGNPPRK